MKTIVACTAVLLVVAGSACGGPGADSPAAAAAGDDAPGDVLTFGSVSLDVAGEHEVFEPFAAHVCSQMASVGIGSGRVLVVESLNRMAEEMGRGSVDVFIDSPFPVALVDRRIGVRILLRRWKRGSAAYRGVIFARSDSGIESAADFRGRMLAFGAPFSTSSFLLPKADLGIMGFEIEAYQDAAAPVPDGRIGYVFSNDAETTMFWVLDKRVAGGAVNRHYFEELAGIRADELRIIHVTRELPRNLVSVRSDLDAAVVQRLEEVLLSLERSAEGRKVLEAFEETVRFDALPCDPQAIRAQMAKLLVHVEEDLGR